MFHILPDHFLYSCQLLEKLYIGIVFASCLPLWIISLLLVWREVLVSGNTIPGTGEDKQSDNN